MKMHLLIIMLLFGIVSPGNAQVNAKKEIEEVSSFNLLNKSYISGKINDTVYMVKIDSLTNRLLNEGVYFDINEMAQHLELYNKIAWSGKEYGSYREIYYMILLNNAYMQDMRGATIYYAEKANAEGRKNGNPRTFIEMAVKIKYLFFTREA